MGLRRHAHGGEWKRARSGDSTANRRKYQLCSELGGIPATGNTIGPIVSGFFFFVLGFVKCRVSEPSSHISV